MKRFSQLVSLISVIFLLLVGMAMGGYAFTKAPPKPKVQEEKPTPSVSEPPLSNPMLTNYHQSKQSQTKTPMPLSSALKITARNYQRLILQ